jgi:hypothetical protein
MQPMHVATMPKIAKRRKDAMTATIVVRRRANMKIINPKILRNLLHAV